MNIKRFLSVFLCVSMLLCILSGCEKKPAVDVHLVYNSELDALQAIPDGGTEPTVTYLWAPIAYEPAELSTTPYAEWDGQPLYEVVGWYANRMLSEEFTGVGGLLYADTMELPTLSEMTFTSAYACSATSVIQALAIIDDPAVLDQCADYLEHGEQAELPQNGDFTLFIKFMCKELPGIYYNVLYIEVGEDSRTADHYLYDRSTKRCVMVPPELFDGWLYGDEVIEGTADVGA